MAVKGARGETLWPTCDSIDVQHKTQETTLIEAEIHADRELGWNSHRYGGYYEMNWNKLDFSCFHRQNSSWGRLYKLELNRIYKFHICPSFIFV